MRHPRFEFVRKIHQYACGYCGITEVSAGSELTVDHYQPLASGGTEDDNNLVYACVKCNQFKHDYWPNTEQLARGLRILHPLLDDISVHISPNNETGLLVALTITGAFHIKLLHLNRPQLIEHRLTQQLYIFLRQQVQILERQVADLEEAVKVKEQYIRFLETAQLK